MLYRKPLVGTNISYQNKTLINQRLIKSSLKSMTYWTPIFIGVSVFPFIIKHLQRLTNQQNECKLDNTLTKMGEVYVHNNA